MTWERVVVMVLIDFLITNIDRLIRDTTGRETRLFSVDGSVWKRFTMVWEHLLMTGVNVLGQRRYDWV